MSMRNLLSMSGDPSRKLERKESEKEIAKREKELLKAETKHARKTSEIDAKSNLRKNSESKPAELDPKSARKNSESDHRSRRKSSEVDVKALRKSLEISESLRPRTPSESTTSIDLNAPLKTEIAALRREVMNIVTEFQLILRAYQEETGQKHQSSDQFALVFQPTPQEKMLEKLLDSPYTSIFTPEVALKNNRASLFNPTQETYSLALAPQRSVMYREVLLPNINLDSLSHDEIVKLSQRDYDILPYKEQKNEVHAYLLIAQMFRDLGLIERFNIPEITLLRFLYVISRRYRNVPFHNFFHAFNVTQTMYFFLRTCHAKDVVSEIDMLALLIATICHDCDHPGLNNDFQKKAQTKIYHLHKKSILENHHFLHCVSLLTRSHTNILVNLSEEETSTVLTTLRELILATDLSIHGLIMKGLTERKKILHKAWKHANPSSLIDEDRKLILCTLIKCSDLSNEIRTPQIGQRWAKLVLEEFFMQSDKEKEMGLPVTAFMDRQKIIIAKEQINFIEKLCMPLYTLASAVFPQIESCVRQLEENRNGWKARLSTFFTNPEEIKKLPNQSIWERKQSKLTGNLTSILAGRATKGAPGPSKAATPQKGK